MVYQLFALVGSKGLATISSSILILILAFLAVSMPYVRADKMVNTKKCCFENIFPKIPKWQVSVSVSDCMESIRKFGNKCYTFWLGLSMNAIKYFYFLIYNNDSIIFGLLEGLRTKGMQRLFPGHQQSKWHRTCLC